MSRMSVRSRGRESIFASSADYYRGDAAAICSPNLRECVLAMEDCAEEVALLPDHLASLALTLLISCRRTKPNNSCEMVPLICRG